MVTLFCEACVLACHHGRNKVRINHFPDDALRRALEEGMLRDAGAVDEDIDWANGLCCLYNQRK